MLIVSYDFLMINIFSTLYFITKTCFSLLNYCLLYFDCLKCRYFFNSVKSQLKSIVLKCYLLISSFQISFKCIHIIWSLGTMLLFSFPKTVSTVDYHVSYYLSVDINTKYWLENELPILICWNKLSHRQMALFIQICAFCIFMDYTSRHSKSFLCTNCKLHHFKKNISIHPTVALPTSQQFSLYAAPLLLV